jgi:hypothetical protein
MTSLGSYIRKGLQNLFLTGGMYFALLIGFQGYSTIISPRIESQSELELKLDENKKRLSDKLGEDILIYPELSTKENAVSYACKINDKEYKIVLSDSSSDVGTLDHELYHIADGHLKNTKLNCNDPPKMGNFSESMVYLFWYEPQATIYQVFGLRP